MMVSQFVIHALHLMVRGLFVLSVVLSIHMNEWEMMEYIVLIVNKDMIIKKS